MLIDAFGLKSTAIIYDELHDVSNSFAMLHVAQYKQQTVAVKKHSMDEMYLSFDNTKVMNKSILDRHGGWLCVCDHKQHKDKSMAMWQWVNWLCFIYGVDAGCVACCSLRSCC